MQHLNQPLDELSRKQVLRQYEIFGTQADPALDGITTLAAGICETPVALITFVGDQRLYIKSSVGCALRELAFEGSFCGQTILQSGPFVVEDAATDVRFADHPLVTGSAAVRFYTGVPLLTSDGQVFGTLCVIDHVPRHLTDAQTNALQILGRQVVTQLELSQKASELNASRRTLAALVRNLPGMVYRCQSDLNRLTYVSEGCLEVTGYEQAELEHDRVVAYRNLVHPEDQGCWLDNCRAALDARITSSCEYRIVNRKGELRWMSDRSRGIYADDGALLGIEGFVQDVTSRKQAEQDSARALSLMRATLDSTADGILVVGPTGKIKTFNMVFVRMWRLPAELLDSGDDARALQFVVDQLSEPQQFIDKVQHLYAHPEAESFDTLAFKDGRYFERYSQSQLVDGKLLGRVWSFRDVTKRVRAEASLSKSEERLKLALDATQDGLWDWNIRTGDVYFSPQWARLLGYDPDEVPARVDFFFTILHPDDISQVNQAITEHLNGQTPVKQGEVRLRMKSGEFRWFLDRGQVVARDASGTPLRMVGTITDITARKHAESVLQETQARTRLLIQAANVGLWDWDLVTNDVYFSPEWKQQLGFADHEVGNRFEEWETRLHPADREHTLKAVRDQIQGRSASYEVEFRLRHKDGSWRWIYARGELAYDAAGHPARMRGCHLDITERRRLAEELRQSHKMEAIGQLAGGVAHDFNNILAAIVGNVELAISDTDPDHPARESLVEIRKASARARSLVKQILAFSRQQPHERRIIMLAPLVEEAVRLLRATMPASVELAVSVAPDVPCVLADSTQLHQVLINLCTNAWHALAGAAGRIDIKVESAILDAANNRLADLPPGRYACIWVTDTGVGIDTATLSRIFEPFFTTKEIGKGTGLGLSVVHGIVHGHGGAVLVDSKPNEGTTFRVYLPAATAGDEALPAASTTSRNGEGRRILFVDDEVALVDVATRMLERLNYRVTGLTSAETALLDFHENLQQFDLVITDLNMPGMSGLEFAAEIRKLRPELPVVMISGHITGELRQRAYIAGINEVLNKPITADELNASIHTLLDLNR